MKIFKFIKIIFKIFFIYLPVLICNSKDLSKAIESMDEKQMEIWKDNGGDNK